MIGLLPMAALTYGPYFFMVPLGAAFIGIPLIGLVSLLTSAFDSYLYKFVLFLLAAGLLLVPLGSTSASTLAIAFDVLVLFPMFYVLLNRRTIWDQLTVDSEAGPRNSTPSP